MFGGQFFGGIHGNFEQRFRCFSMACIDKAHLENGDKLILPPSALGRLSSLNIDYPMLFEIRNEKDGSHSHCGVLEFTADEGVVYMPHWMQQNMLMEEGDLVKLKSVSLPKGTYVKLRPHTKDFLDISNPKAVLETSLRNYTCLTVGDSFMVNYNNKRYYIDVVEAKPANAISIVETDCEVDFTEPLDYVEPEKDYGRPAPAPATAPVVAPFGRPPPNKAIEQPEEAPKFAAFVGSGNRLDGKAASTLSSSSSLSSNPGGSSSAAGSSGQQEEAPKPAGMAAGKVLFGGNGLRKPGELKKPGDKKKKKEKEPEPEEPKFKAFGGTGNRLK